MKIGSILSLKHAFGSSLFHKTDNGQGVMPNHTTILLDGRYKSDVDSNKISSNDTTSTSKNTDNV